MIFHFSIPEVEAQKHLSGLHLGDAEFFSVPDLASDLILPFGLYPRLLSLLKYIKILNYSKRTIIFELVSATEFDYKHGSCRFDHNSGTSSSIQHTKKCFQKIRTNLLSDFVLVFQNPSLVSSLLCNHF